MNELGRQHVDVGAEIPVAAAGRLDGQPGDPGVGVAVQPGLHRRAEPVACLPRGGRIFTGCLAEISLSVCENIPLRLNQPVADGKAALLGQGGDLARLSDLKPEKDSVTGATRVTRQRCPY